MLSSVLVSILVIIFVILFIFYKRNMLLQVFSLNMKSSANQLQEELEKTADLVIQQLEERIKHLEELLETADTSIVLLDEKIRAANKPLEKKTEDRIDCPIEVISNPSEIKLEEDQKKEVKELGQMAMPINGNQKIGVDNYKELARSNKRNTILSMADQGYSSTEIAKITGISKSEIILLLQLNKK
ncbi:hypothetical protein [Pelosinus sp. UFO1]|uniref:hypothetical protein n=1 Tax=Pelosinus sp. UFO1 TaxID=484770 RepID=UPI0004D1BF3C|nr:hypothetical protein [Pelosinus sp. UFO1]AIF52095.1 hypothetical protein UFO1_2548 [Pelosinus sp. UFO1]